MITVAPQWLTKPLGRVVAGQPVHTLLQITRECLPDAATYCRESRSSDGLWLVTGATAVLWISCQIATVVSDIQ